MEFSGSQTIAAPIEKVWAFLLDVNNVAGCAPGFQSLEVLGDRTLESGGYRRRRSCESKIHHGCDTARNA